MQCVNDKYVVEELIKKSRFIGIIFPSPTERIALQAIQQLHFEHAHASHIVFAYRIKAPNGFIYRFHDAGEPSGTAGKPVFQHLEGKNLINTAIVVIRYYGGIKLGAGGLTRAYGNTASLAIEHATFSEYIQFEKRRFVLDYPQFQEFEYHLKKHQGNILEQQFAQQITLVVELPQSEIDVLSNRFSGQTVD